MKIKKMQYYLFNYLIKHSINYSINYLINYLIEKRVGRKHLSHMRGPGPGPGPLHARNYLEPTLFPIK